MVEGKEAAVEVHRLPVPVEYSKDFNYDVLKPRVKAAQKNKQLLVLSDPDKLMHNFIHAQLANKAHLMGIISLRSSYEYLLLLQRNSEIIQCHKSKFMAYNFLSTILFTGGSINGGFTAKNYFFRFHMNQRFRRWATFYKISIYLFLRLANYLKLLVESPFDSNIRKSIVYRLKDRKWYAMHFASYKSALKNL